ncbi:MAG TPA: right-handed parallel beta-helix repeat-containing protein [Candidatus Limnocylindrales bacterium]|nr:right-handed parallel beta-helix repeat-containing protein [Candidatus Limnocylindrales bacterium]
MKRKLLKTLALITILIAIAGTVKIQGTRASRTLTVPDEYPTINAAVNQASAGDTILVKNGVYHENVQISKSLTLEGQNSSDTIIMGSGGAKPAAVLTLGADNVRVSGFTIESLNYSSTASYAYGIWVEGNNCTITGNIIENTYTGIFCSIQSSTTISQNTVKSCRKNGICFYGGFLNSISSNDIVGNAVSGIEIEGYSNTIVKNNIQGNYRGVGLGASYSVLFDNNIQSNAESGVFLAGSQNVISANAISNNKYGIYVTLQLTAPLANRIYHNNLANNIYNAYDNSLALIEYWDNGAKSGGNYWSNYLSSYPDASQVGTSGIGNTPYAINSNNTDNYPLMSPFDTSNTGNPPTPISPPLAKPNSVVASWSLGTVYPSLVTPDATGNNPAVLGSEIPSYNYTPALVPGKFGEALNFTGNAYATVHPSPSLETPEDVTISAWVNVQAIKDVHYNNIFIEAVRNTTTLPTRTLGLAINGQAPENASSPPLGALRGYVATPSGLNEIDTTTALPNDTWVYVVFARSTSTGMHIYVNGVEQPVTVAAGTADPKGPVQSATDIYIGHDSKTEIEDLQISNTVAQTQPLWMQWWLWAIIVLAVALASGLILHSKRFKQ